MHCSPSIVRTCLLNDVNIGRVGEMYPTSLTPSPSFIGVYIMAIYIMQVGYCVVLVIARKSETKVSLLSRSTGVYKP